MEGDSHDTTICDNPRSELRPSYRPLSWVLLGSSRKSIPTTRQRTTPTTVQAADSSPEHLPASTDAEHDLDSDSDFASMNRIGSKGPQASGMFTQAGLVRSGGRGASPQRSTTVIRGY